MFHGLGALLIIIPPYSLYALGAVLIICILSLIVSARICKIRSADMQIKNYGWINTTFLLFIVSEVAVVVSTVLMVIISVIFIGPLTRVNNEFGGIPKLDLFFYYVIYGLIYANLQFPSAFILKETVGNQFAGFFVCFCAFNTGIWVIANIVLGFLGIPR